MHRLAGHPIATSHISHRRTPKDLPTLPDTSAPQHSAPPTRQDLLREFREGWNQEVSPTYRSQCRPGTGAASTKWNPPTGATMSSINRSRTRALGFRMASVKFRYPCSGLAPVPVFHSRVGFRRR